MRSILLGMVILGNLAPASSVRAEASTAKPFEFVLPKMRDAHEHLRRGVRLYNNQSFEAAIEEFKAGALIEPCVAFDYNLGQAYRQLGKYKEALWHYQRFLDDGNPTGHVLEAVQRWIAEMRTHLDNPALTAPPTEPASEAPKSPVTQGPRPAPAPARSATPAGDPRELGLHDDRASSPNWFGWGMTGGGVVTIGVGGYLLLRASSLDDQANGTVDAHTRNALHDQANTRGLVGAIVGAGGLVLTAAGIYGLATHARHRDRPTSAAVDVGIAGRGFVVFGRF